MKYFLRKRLDRARNRHTGLVTLRDILKSKRKEFRHIDGKIQDALHEVMRLEARL